MASLPPLSSFVGTTPAASASGNGNMPSLSSFQQTDPNVTSNFNAVNGSESTDNSGGGFASQTIQNAQDYETENQSDIQNSMMQGALAPMSASDIQNEPLSAIPDTAINTASDAWAIGKGLLTLPWHANEMIKNIVQDPTSLLGPAAQQLATGFEASKQSGDWSNLWKGLNGAASALVNHPLTSVVSFLQPEGEAATLDEAGNVVKPASGVLNTLKQLGTTPIRSTTDAVVNAAKNITGKITNAIDSLQGLSAAKENPMSALAKSVMTPAQQSEILTQSVDAINEQMGKLQDDSQTIRQAISALPKDATDEASALQAAQFKNDAEIKNLQNIQQTILGLHTLSAETRTGISIGDNTPGSVGTGIADRLDQAQSTVAKGYEDVVPPGQYPSLQPIIDGLKQALEEAKQSTDKSFINNLQSKIDDLTSRQEDTETYKNAKNPADAERILRNKANALKMKQGGVDEKTIQEYGLGKNALDTKPPISSSFLKTNTQSEIKGVFDGSDATGKMYEKYMKPAFDKVFKSTMNDSQKGQYSRLDQQYKALNKGSLAKKVRDASPSKLVKLLRDKETVNDLNTVHPGFVDAMQHAVLKDAVDSAKGSPEKTIANLDDVKDVIPKDEYMVHRQIAEEQINADKQAETIKQSQKTNMAKQKIVGTTPEETMARISNIKSVDELNEFTKATGAKAEDVGRMYVRGILDKYGLPDDGNIIPSKANIQKIIKANEEIQKFSNNGLGEGNKLGDKMFGGKDSAVSKLNNASKIMEKALDAKTSSGVKRAAKLLAAPVLAYFGHWLAAGYFVKDTVGDMAGKAPLDDEADLSATAKKGPGKIAMAMNKAGKSVNPKSLKVQVGTAAANAENNNNL